MQFSDSDFDQVENASLAVQHATIKVLDLPRHVSIYPKPQHDLNLKNTNPRNRRKLAAEAKKIQKSEKLCPKLSYFLPTHYLSHQEDDSKQEGLTLPLPTLSVPKDKLPTLSCDESTCYGRQKYHSFLGNEWMDTLRLEELDLL